MLHEANGNKRELISGIDGVLCPVCGEVVKELPVRVHRVLADKREQFWVCSPACKETALRSPYLQTNLFERDYRIWSRSVQMTLDIPDRRNGVPEGAQRDLGGNVNPAPGTSNPPRDHLISD